MNVVLVYSHVWVNNSFNNFYVHVFTFISVSVPVHNQHNFFVLCYSKIWIWWVKVGVNTRNRRDNREIRILESYITCKDKHHSHCCSISAQHPCEAHKGNKTISTSMEINQSEIKTRSASSTVWKSIKVKSKLDQYSKVKLTLKEMNLLYGKAG